MHQHLSRTTAIPCPPPIHAAPSAHFLSSRCKLCVKFARILTISYVNGPATREDLPGSARSEWMSNGNRSTEHVGPLHRQLQLLLHGQPLRRESLLVSPLNALSIYLTSLTSMMSISSIVLPTFFSTSLIDTTGPMPMISGSHALHE